jgi:DNA-directed RNA polymerase specialized sigma24 family protein
VKNGPEIQVLNLGLTKRMGKILGLAPSSQREIIALRITVGLSSAETAEALGRTEGAVRTARHRALTKLRGMVDDEFWSGPERLWSHRNPGECPTNGGSWSDTPSCAWR